MQLKRKNKCSSSGIFLVCLFGLLPFSSYAVPDIDVQAFAFKLSPEEGMAEISVYCVGSTLNCTTSPDDEYGIEYILFVKDTSSNVISGSRYRVTTKGACPAKDIFDIKRLKLPPGKYIIEIEANDIQNSELKVTASSTLIIPTETNLSDIQLLAAATQAKDNSSELAKSGILPEPLGFQYYHAGLKNALAYLETYNTNSFGGKPYVQYGIYPVNSEIPAPIISYKKLVAQSTQALLLNLDISMLISGEYYFEVILFKDIGNEVTKKKVFFTRSNPVGDSIYFENYGNKLEESFASNLVEDSLEYYLKAIASVVPGQDVEVLNGLIRNGSSKAKRFFLHRYWTQQGGKFASVAFNQYMGIARKVDDSFRSGFGYGFETDRGHIFLKYGRPFDHIVVEDEPSAPPYEIWFYDYFPATGQQNVRFLFYNPDLTKNGHILLHSTARGEINNPRWEVELYKDATSETPDVNTTVMGSNVYRKARQYFEK